MAPPVSRTWNHFRRSAGDQAQLQWLLVDTVLLLGMAFLMLWAGLTLLISALGGRRGRPALIGRLRSYQYLVGDKAEEWLQSQG